MRADFVAVLAENYLLKNDAWKYDIMPEVQDGKNVADFIDPDIIARLEELEAEEERLEAAGFYDDEDDVRLPLALPHRTLTDSVCSSPQLDSDEDAIRTAASAIRDKKAHIRLVNAQKNKLQNRPVIPRTVQTRNLSDMTKKLTEAGYDPSNLEERARVLAKARGLIGADSRKRTAGDMDVDEGSDEEWGDDGEEGDEMEVDGEGVSRKRAKTSIVSKGKRTPGTDRQIAGLKDAEVRRFLLIVGLSVADLAFLYSKRPRRSSCVRFTSVDPIDWPRLPSRIVTSERRCPNICSLERVRPFSSSRFRLGWLLTLFVSCRKGRKDQPSLSGGGSGARRGEGGRRRCWSRGPLYFSEFAITFPSAQLLPIRALGV